MGDSRALVADLRANLDDAADAAGDAVGVRETHVRIAGCSIRIQTVGSTLAAIVGRAFGALAGVAPGSHDLTIRVWDTAGSGVALPAPPWSEADYLPGGRIRGFDDPDHLVAFDLPTGTLNVLDRAAGTGYCWSSDARRLPSWFLRSPFRLLLGWWALDRDLCMVHAGGCGDPGAVVLVTGAGGAGKSSTVFSARRAGLRVLSDDLCLLEAGAPPRAHALYGTAKLEPDGADRLPEVHARAVSGDGMVELGDDLVASAPVRAAVTLDIAPGPSRVEVTTPGDCLRSLAPSSIIGPAAQPPDAMRTMAAALRAVPCFRVVLGPDPDDVAATIRGLLDEVR